MANHDPPATLGTLKDLALRVDSQFWGCEEERRRDTDR